MASPEGTDALPARVPKSLRGLATALTSLLAMSALFSVASVIALVRRIIFLDRFERRDFASVREVRRAGQAADDAVSLALGTMLLLGIVVLVVLIVFLYRAARNTQAWDSARPGWAPGWSIGGWFLPVANLVVPALVVRSTWRRTPEPDSAQAPPSTLVWTWWLCWVVGALAYWAPRGGTTIEAYRNADRVGIAVCAVLVVASVSLIVVVQRLSDRQRRLGNVVERATLDPDLASVTDPEHKTGAWTRIGVGLSVFLSLAVTVEIVAAEWEWPGRGLLVFAIAVFAGALVGQWPTWWNQFRD